MRKIIADIFLSSQNFPLFLEAQNNTFDNLRFIECNPFWATFHRWISVKARMVINNLIGNNDSDCWEKGMPFVCFIVSTTITSIFANLAMAGGPKKYRKTTSKATCTRIIGLVIRKAPCRHYASHFESEVQNDMFKGFTLPRLIDNNTRYVHTSLKSY